MVWSDGRSIKVTPQTFFLWCHSDSYKISWYYVKNIMKMREFWGYVPILWSNLMEIHKSYSANIFCDVVTIFIKFYGNMWKKSWKWENCENCGYPKFWNINTSANLFIFLWLFKFRRVQVRRQKKQHFQDFFQPGSKFTHFECFRSKISQYSQEFSWWMNKVT